MMWVLAMYYLPYLSQEFRDTVNYFRKEMTGKVQAFAPKWYKEFDIHFTVVAAMGLCAWLLSIGSSVCCTFHLGLKSLHWWKLCFVFRESLFHRLENGCLFTVFLISAKKMQREYLKQYSSFQGHSAI
jgi:hypothetical protein